VRNGLLLDFIRARLRWCAPRFLRQVRRGNLLHAGSERRLRCAGLASAVDPARFQAAAEMVATTEPKDIFRPQKIRRRALSKHGKAHCLPPGAGRRR